MAQPKGRPKAQAKKPPPKGQAGNQAKGQAKAGPPKGRPKADPVAATVSARPEPDLARILPLVGLGVAFWASLPQWSGPKLNVEASKEVVDHIVPAILVVLCCVAGIMASRRPQGPGAIRFMAGLGVLLAGLWMMATHIPLVLEATRDESPWPATIYHTSSALAVFGLGLLWATVTWSEAGDESQPAPAKAQK